MGGAVLHPVRRLTTLFVVAFALAPLTALEAGERHTVWAYPPGAGPKGSAELETWVTAGRAESHSGTSSEYRVEVENGLTDNVSLDLYLAVVTQAPGEGARFDRVQASLRANLVREPFNLPVDLTGYFEIKRDLQFDNPWEFETILIGGKSFGRFNYAFNLVYESELSSKAFQRAVREQKGIIAAGYEVTPRLWAGAEFIAADAGGTKEYSAGPTLSFTLTERTWIAVGPQFGINRDADRLKVRAIFGIFL